MRRTSGIPRIGAINRSHPHARGLVSCWRAMPDMERGSKWYDLAGKNHGTLINGPTWRGDALGFNGSNNYVSIPSAPSLDITTAITVSARIKLNATSGNQRFIAKWDGSDAWILELAADGNYKFWVDTASVENAATTVGVEAGIWHLITGTYDGAAIRIYVDGIERSSTAQTGSITTNSHALFFGTDEFFGENAFSAWLNGAIGDVRIYNRALSATEVKSLYTDPLGMFNRVRVPVGRAASATGSKLLLRLASEGLFVGSHY